MWKEILFKSIVILMVWAGGLASGYLLGNEKDITTSELLPLHNRCKVLDDGHVTYLKLTGEQSEFYRYGDVVCIDTLTHTISENPDGTLVVRIVK